MNRKSIFYKLFVSYATVGLLLILSFGTMLYYFNVASLNAEVRGKHYASVTQSMSRIDYMLESMSNVANHFSGSELRVRLSEESTDGHGGFILSQLQNYEPNLPEPMRLMLYMRGDTRVFLSDSEYPYQTFEEMAGADLVMSKLFSVLNSCHYAKAVRLLRNSGSGGDASSSMAFVYPIPYMGVIPDMSLTFFVNDADFDALFDNYFGDAGRNVYLLDKSFQMIYRNESSAYTDRELRHLMGLKGTGVLEDALEGRGDVVMRAISNHSGYTLIVTMEESDFFSRVSLMRTVVAMCMILFVLLTFMLAFLLTMRSYRPIRALMSLARRGEDGGGPPPWRGSGGNELEFLQTHIRSAHDRNQELGVLLDKQRPYIAHACIEALLRGKGSAAELAFQMQCANMTFPHPYYQVLAVCPASKGILREKLQNILAACEETFFEDTVLYCTENIMEKQISMILNIPSRASNDAVSVARKIQAALTSLCTEVSIGIGSVRGGAEDIHQSYMEAMVALKDYLPNHPGHILCFTDIPADDPIDYSLSYTEQSLLLQALRQGDKTVALQTLSGTLDRISRAGGSVLLTQYLCFDISHTLIQVMNEAGNNPLHADLRSLARFASLEEFHGWAARIVEEICMCRETIMEQKNTQLSSELIQFVNASYRDCGLSLEQMSTRFDLSPGYLSRFFKQATGQTFMSYVTKLRMDYVRGNLLHTDKKIKEIVVEAGYLDTASFVRKFKAAEGMTPGQFRKRAREQNG